MPPTAIVRHQAEKNGLVQWPDRRVRSHTAPSPSTVTMVQPRSAIAISRPAPRPTNAPPSCHPLRHRSQIPIDSPPARHRRATPARGFLPRGFSDACRPSTRPRSSAAGIQEALTRADLRRATTANRVRYVAQVMPGHRSRCVYLDRIARAGSYPCRKRRSASRLSCSACLVTRAFVAR